MYLVVVVLASSGNFTGEGGQAFLLSFFGCIHRKKKEDIF